MNSASPLPFLVSICLYIFTKPFTLSLRALNKAQLSHQEMILVSLLYRSRNRDLEKASDFPRSHSWDQRCRPQQAPLPLSSVWPALLQSGIIAALKKQNSRWQYAGLWNKGPDFATCSLHYPRVFKFLWILVHSSAKWGDDNSNPCNKDR